MLCFAHEYTKLREIINVIKDHIGEIANHAF